LQGHIVSDVFQDGFYWLVKSRQVKIQAFYGRGGGWQIHAIAFGGEFLEGHRLVIEQLYEGIGRVTWDGDVVSIRRNSMKMLSTLASVQMEMNGRSFETILVNLPAGVKLELVRDTWNNGAGVNVNAYITMRKQPGQDGQCGKADGNFAEDEYGYIARTWGRQVPARKRLFDQGSLTLLEESESSREDNATVVCANNPPLPEAIEACQAALQSSPAGLAEALMPGCLVDACAMGQEAANGASAAARRAEAVLEAAGEPEPLPADGWYDGGAGQSCDEGCGVLGLICTEEQLLAHNADVDTSEEVVELVTRLAGGTWLWSSMCTLHWAEEDDVPNWSAGVCHPSSSTRALSTFNCAARPRGGWLPKHRLCYCHAPIQATVHVS